MVRPTRHGLAPRAADGNQPPHASRSFRYGSGRMDLNQRRIAHLDMDAFYASVELLRYPELRGLPVVIGGRRDQQPELLADGSRRFFRLRDYVGRGVATTSTYEARALGVFSAMGMMKAAKLAPEAILLPVDFDAYRHYSRLFKAAVATIAPKIEDRGIDEIYIDLSDLPDDTLTLARRIKQAVKDATGLSCSAAQGLSGPHHRHQAALRGFPHRHARPDASGADRRPGGDPSRRRRMPAPRAAAAETAPARCAHQRAVVEQRAAAGA